jgi:GT2 family glycosyltransferase
MMNRIEFLSREYSQMSPVVSRVAVGIVVFNNSKTQLSNLARTLRKADMRLAREKARPTEIASVLLHNNGDSPIDTTPFGPLARVTDSQANLGFGRAHNLLMAGAFAEGAEFYLALNPDGMLHPDAIFEMIAVARRYEGRALVEAAQFPEEPPKIFDPLTLDTPWASGCCLLIPTTVYAAIGGFDENFFMFCEDVDLSWRVRHSGFAVKHAPRALFHHRFNRPGSNDVIRRIHLDAARYLLAKWGLEALVRQVENEMASHGWEPRLLPTPMPSPLVSSIPDASHMLNFASSRWTCPGPIPIHTISRHSEVDNTIDVIVRFHDTAQIRRLSRCLFSLYGQEHQPIQVLLMLQGLDDADVAAVEACVDAFDWAEPRRRPVVTNVAVPPMGDHRSKLWNAGLDVVRARYLGFCDFDDTCFPAGYSYLLHRLQYTGAAAVFASALHVDCTPMNGFDFAFAKHFLAGEDRYDFFIRGFCPTNSILLDRSRIAPADLRADETLSKQEDYRVLAVIAAKYETDWKSIGTVVGEYNHRTDGSNTVLSHRWDAAGRREWNEAVETSRKYLATFTTKVPVSDIVRMRGAERSLRQELAEREAELARILAEREAELARIMNSRSMRITHPLRAVGDWIRRVLK